MLLKSVRCAVDNHRYHYYGVKDDYAWHLPSSTRPGLASWMNTKLFRESDIVWCQGRRGGVKLVRFNAMKSTEFRKYGYITQDEEAMKEFAWAKLRAQTFGNIRVY